MSGGTFKWYPAARAQLERAFLGALTQTADDIAKDAERREVVPHAEGARKQGHTAGRLASSVEVMPAKGAKGARIQWSAPFAARAYFHPEWEFSQNVHGAAKGRWMDDYMDGGELSGYARDRYRANLGGTGVLFK